MVSGFVTSPLDHPKIFSGEASFKTIDWKSVAFVSINVKLKLFSRGLAENPFFIKLPVFLLAGWFKADEVNVEREPAQFVQKNMERRRHIRAFEGLSPHYRVVSGRPAQNVVGFNREHFLQNVRRAVTLKRPHLHFAETLSSALRFASQRLLGD